MIRAADAWLAGAVALGWGALSWRSGVEGRAVPEAAHAVGVVVAGVGMGALVRACGGVGQAGCAGAAAAVALVVRGHPWAALLGVVAWCLARARLAAGDPWRAAVRSDAVGRVGVGVDAVGWVALGVPPAWGAVPWLAGQVLGLVALGRLLARVGARWPAAPQGAAAVGLGAAWAAAWALRGP